MLIEAIHCFTEKDFFLKMSLLDFENESPISVALCLWLTNPRLFQKHIAVLNIMRVLM